jgi:hypothetical protein
MTLQEMTNLIITELGVYDDTSIALCKQFLNKEYHTLWDKYPWAGTQMIGIATIVVGQSTVTMPAGMGMAITVRATNVSTGLPTEPDAPDATFRSDARFLDPITATFLIQTDPSILERGGYVKYYEEDTDPVTGVKSLKVYPRPTVNTELFIIGKRICPGLINNSDISIIPNLDPAIIAYAYFDMLQRQRQYAKADIKRKEAQELEAVAWSVEQQQANRPRMTKTTTVAGNSLAEMTDAVCMICGQWTPDVRLVIQEFLRRNYQAAYDTFLWPESLVAVRVPYTTEQVILPHYVDKVIGVRGTNKTRMFPADAGLILDITPASFDEIGDPISYTVLTPVAVWTIPAQATKLKIASSSVADLSTVMIRGEVIESGLEIEEQIVLKGTNPIETKYAYDIPLTISKDITNGDITVNASSDGRSLVVIPFNQRELKHQRLWFLPVPNWTPSSDPSVADPEPFICLVLAKRKIHPLVTEQDTPIITGVQSVLIAAAAADFYRSLGKIDLSTVYGQKADGAMNVLKAKNYDQAASSPRFVPEIEPRAYIGVGELVCFK